MKINTYELDKVNQAYDGDHDLGPDAPVHWSVFELAYMVNKLVKVIEEQDERLKQVEGENINTHQRLKTLESRVEAMARRVEPQRY